MRIYKIVFSPTGGTDKCINEILSGLNGENVSVDMTDPQFNGKLIQIEKEDICVFGVPSYGGRIPNLCAERIKQINGNEARSIAVAVFGNRAQEDTLLELCDLLHEENFRVIAGVAAVAEHSIIRTIAKGRPDNADKDELRDFSNRINAKICSNNSKIQDTVPGNHPYKKQMEANLKIKVSEKCTKCGLCALQCPVSAIPTDNPLITGNTCIDCMRCISACPTHARSLEPKMIFTLTAFLKTAAGKRKSNSLYL